MERAAATAASRAAAGAAGGGNWRRPGVWSGSLLGEPVTVTGAPRYVGGTQPYRQNALEFHRYGRGGGGSTGLAAGDGPYLGKRGRSTYVNYNTVAPAEMMGDRDPDTGERFPTVAAMREKKLRDWEAGAAKVRNLLAAQARARLPPALPPAAQRFVSRFSCSCHLASSLQRLKRACEKDEKRKEEGRKGGRGACR